MLISRYGKKQIQKNLQDLCCLADFCIFIQRNELESTGISFPYFISAKEIFAEKSHWHKGWYRRDFYYNDTISNLILVEDGNIVRGPVGGDWDVKKTALITFAGKRKQFIIFNIAIRDTLYIEIINEEKEVIDSLSFVRIEDWKDRSKIGWIGL